MPNWIMYSEYYNEGNGKAFPILLTDREKMIIQKMFELDLHNYTKKFEFVEVEE